MFQWRVQDRILNHEYGNNAIANMVYSHCTLNSSMQTIQFEYLSILELLNYPSKKKFIAQKKNWSENFCILCRNWWNFIWKFCIYKCNKKNYIAKKYTYEMEIFTTDSNLKKRSPYASSNKDNLNNLLLKFTYKLTHENSNHL